MSPDRPVLRGTAQNPDVFFQARETVNPFYTACPAIVQKAMDKFATLAGRQYHLFDYVGAPDAERVIVLMGSGAEAAQETVEYLNAQRREGRRAEGPPVPAVLGRALHRRAARDRQEPSPCSTAPRNRAPPASRSTWTSSPPSAKAMAAGTAPFKSMPEGRRRPLRPVLEGIHAGHGQGRLRRPGASRSPKNHFTVGINDDVTHTSLDVRSGLLDRRSDDVSARCSTAWARTARSARTRTRSRSSARTPTTTPRATSCTTRRRPARSPSRTCASARSRSARPT